MHARTGWLGVVELGDPGDGEGRLSPHLLHSEAAEPGEEEGVAGRGVGPRRHLLHTRRSPHTVQLRAQRV